MRRIISMLALGLVATTVAGCDGHWLGAGPSDGSSDAAAPVAAAPAAGGAPAIAEPAAAAAGSAQSGEPGAVYYEGSGRFLNPQTSPKQARVAADDGRITLNFVDAEVRDVVRTVLGGTLGLNYAIDPAVKGTITLQTSKPLKRSDVLPTLENVLRLNGIALAQSGEVYDVIPIDSAARGNVAPSLRSSGNTPGEAYGIQIVPLKYASAAEMAKIVEPLTAPGSVLRVDTQRNLLIIAGTRRERETLLGIVDVFDVDWLSGMSFAMVPLELAKPDELIGDLEKVFGSKEDGPLAGVVRFYPIERRNAVLVIASRPEYIDKARQWIARLDVGDAKDQQLYVYSVQNGRATDIAAILSQVFGTESGSTPVPRRDLAPGRRPGQISSPSSSSSSTLGSTRGTFPTLSAQAVGPVLSADQARPAPATGPSGASPSAAPAPSRPARVARGAPTPVPTAARPAVTVPEDTSVRIIADDVNNALVIRARPPVYRMIEAALRKLDVVPLQVMIEATIAEVTLNKTLRYGVQWFFKKGSSTFTWSNQAGTVVSRFPAFSYAFTTADIRTVLDALQSVSRVHVLSSPQLMVLDNRTAELTVGKQVPIATQSAVSVTDPNAPVVNSIQFRDTGAVLRVTPRVNASGLVTLDIEQEQSDALPTDTSGINSPTINQRRITSSVVVRSGVTVALGGLISNNATNSTDGIPLLSDIPIIGNLFKYNTDTDARSELIVLITPRVVRNQEEARAVTDELRERLRNAASLAKPALERRAPERPAPAKHERVKSPVTKPKS